ncbi:interleukin-27 receptor subunit alpha [Spea bombifrons]|uniref:interleukin-27 receptor subunit alpha n=1 Tax=Spea bombifrons TaxID=233779 RepID=UPI0023496911|nr:interleukin-27 receptor subunit alpha [Spea bombifrons]
MRTEVTISRLNNSGMSARCRIRTTVPQPLLLLLLMNCSVCAGIIEVCSLCCVLRGQDEGLNCTWNGNADTQRTLHIQSLKYNSDRTSVLSFTSLPGQNWLLIPRQKLTKYDRYHLRLEWDGGEDSLTITYEDNGENVLIEPPVLSPDVTFNEEDPTTAEVAWSAPSEGSHHHEAELWYRKLGQDGWLEAEPSDLEAGTYEMTKLEPFTKYQVKIRYLPNESSKDMGSLWSEPITFGTPEEVPTGPLDLWRHFGQSISLVWKPPDDRYARGHILNYVVTYIHNGKSYTTEASCCEVKLPNNSTHMCVSARNSKGNGPSTCAAPLCSDKNFSLLVTVERNPNGGITVWFGEPLSLPSDHPTYLVEWTEITERGNAMINWTRSQADGQNVTLPGTFLPHVPYQVSVFALYQNSCRGPFSTTVYGHQGVPSAAPDFSVIPLSCKGALIFWKELPVWQQRGLLTHYTVYLNSTARSRQHAATGRNLTLTDLMCGTLYHVWVTASTTAGEGPPGAHKSFHTIGPGPDSALIVFVVLTFALLLSGAFAFVYTLWWQKIPSPQNSHVGAGNFIYSNGWLLKQVPSHPPIAVVEEEELPPAVLAPPATTGQTPITVLEGPESSRNKSANFGYEKHFLPTREEVMGLC